MRTLKIAGVIVAAAIVVIALAAVMGIPSGFLTSTIQQRVERDTGYRLAINGGAKIGIWPTFNIALNDIALQDPKNRDARDLLTATSVRAEMTLASLWSGHPEIRELEIVRPVVNLPLRRERSQGVDTSAKSTRTGEGGAVTIEQVSVTDGTLVFFNQRDRVENRIETVNLDATMDSDRKVVMTGNARASGQPLKFVINATAPASPIERQNIPTELAVEAPGLLQAPLSAKAEVRLSGSVVMINSVSGMLGDGAFNGWASVDVASKPVVKLDLDFQRLSIAAAQSQGASAAQPWSNATFELNGLNYVDAQARLSAAEVVLGDGRFASAEIEATLASGVLKANLSNLGAYEGTVNADLTIDASSATPTYALRTDLTGVRALPMLKSLAGFDKLDGRMQTKIAVRSSGNSQRAIMANMSGTAFAVFQDGAIRGLNVAQMIRSLTTSPLSGWQESQELSTDLTQLSASFKIDKGQAVTTDLNLIGPLVKMTGVGTIDLGTRQIGFRVEPTLVMTTEGQGRAGDPVGLGIPVMIEGPWDGPRIYPEMQGILDNPDATYAKLREMGKGLFGAGGLNALGTLLGGGQAGSQGGSTAQGQGGNAPGAANGQSGQAGGLLDGQLGEALGNLLQKGLSGFGQGSGSPRPGQGRGIPAPPASNSADAPTQAAPPPPDSADQRDSQPMNDVLRQLFNR